MVNVLKLNKKSEVFSARAHTPTYPLKRENYIQQVFMSEMVKLKLREVLRESA